MKAMHLIKKISRAVLALAVMVVIAANSSAQPLDANHASVRAVIAVQNAVTKQMMALPDILGTAVGLDENDQLALVVYVNLNGKNAAAAGSALHGQKVRGVRVAVELTDPFIALWDSGSAHRVKQTPPIKLGTSGGWRHDLANGFCCGGTLGSLIQVNGVQYILSNYHVLEADIVSGGNSQVAQTGDPVIQPGLIDLSCNALNAQDVATLVKLSSLPDSNVDASVAQIIAGQVDSSGAILDIGTISSQTVGASLSQKVKKSGRTTGLTRSSISGLNATVSVTYDNECAGGTAFTKTFTGQILIKNKNRGVSFIAGGDSGSLMVQDVTTSPQAVGLLFAGSSTTAVANPINAVLAFVGTQLGGTATMVGQ